MDQNYTDKNKMLTEEKMDSTNIDWHKPTNTIS